MQLIDVNVVTTSWREINGTSLNIADLYACSWFTKKIDALLGFSRHLAFICLTTTKSARFQAGTEVQLFPLQEA